MAKRIFLLILTILTLILEIIPYGAVCIFQADGGKRIIQTFSYFDLIPFGYANFGPILTAMLTCVLLVLTFIYALKCSKRLNTAITTISAVATATSLLPLLYGIEFYSIVATVITALLAATFGCSLIKNKMV